MRNKTAELEALINEIRAFESFSESDIEKLMTAFEKKPREEVSTFYAAYFQDPCLAHSLIDVAQRYEHNDKIVVNVISSLGNMLKRYGLMPSDQLYDFFIANAKKRKIRYDVALFLSIFPQFEQASFRWDYLLSIPTAAPRNKAEHIFFFEIKRIVSAKEKIPPPYDKEVIKTIKSFLEKGRHPVVADEYKELIEAIRTQ